MTRTDVTTGPVAASDRRPRGRIHVTTGPVAASDRRSRGRIHATNRDGSRGPYDADRIDRAIERAASGPTDPISKVTQIASELAITLFDGIDAVEQGLLDERLLGFDLDALAAALDPRRDERLRYIGTVTMRDRYMLTDRNGRPLEVPQDFWMRVATGLSPNEEDPTAAAIRFYQAIARLEYLPAGSTPARGTPSCPTAS